MPSPASRPRVIVDPIVPGQKNKKPKQPKLKPKLPGAEKPYPMPRIINDGVFPSPAPYSPIKQTKTVDKVYKTY